MVDNDNERTALDNWGNAAIEIHDPSTEARAFLRALLTEVDDVDNSLSSVLDARHINTASGSSLDRIGELGGIQRRTNEGDDKYRARIKANITAGNSGATFDDVASFTAATLQIDPSTVDIDTNFDEDPVAVVTNIDFSSLDNTNLSRDDFLEVLEELVPAAHTTILEANGTFELSSDSYTPPSGTGLTDDSGTKGGVLAGYYRN